MAEEVWTLIITTSEATCEQISDETENLPFVKGVFQDSGFWYSNGETGPEWFTVHIQVSPKDKSKLEKFLDELDMSVGNRYWG